MHTLVIARFREDLDWVLEVPDEYAVVVYNKGPDIIDKALLARVSAVIPRPNVGRESETYCHHLLTAPHPAEGFTVFSQGDPFGHSPDFLALLRRRADWSDIQALGCRWKPGFPPPEIQLRDPHDRIGDLRVRRETFSLCYWGSLHFYDFGAARTGCRYWNGSLENGGQPANTNVASDFLARCGFHDIAAQAARHLLGRFSYGAIFAVRNVRMAKVSAPAMERMRKSTTVDPLYGYVIERLWLHIFGEPFLMPIQDAAFEEDMQTRSEHHSPYPNTPPPSANHEPMSGT